MIIHRSKLNPRVRKLKDCIAPIDKMPQTKEGAKIIRQYETDNPIILKLRHRPHLKLKHININLDRARKEVDQFYKNTEEFMKLDMKGLPDTNSYDYEGHHMFWSSRALVNYTPSSYGTWGKDDREIAIKKYPDLQEKALKVKDRRVFLNDMNFYKTEVWDALPYITSFIMENLCSDFKYMRRTHLYNMKPRGCLTFHNHRLLPWETEEAPHDEGIIHIPLYTNEDCKMLSQIGDSDWIDAQHYKEGETWLLNTYMNHGVDATKCMIDRLHLVIMIDFTDPKFTDVLEESL